VVDVPWDIAVGGDLVFPGVQGRRTLKVRLVNAYLARLHAAAAHDARLASAFVRVAGLVARPQSLLRPGVAVRVLRGRLRPVAGTGGRRQWRPAAPCVSTRSSSHDLTSAQPPPLTPLRRAPVTSLRRPVAPGQTILTATLTNPQVQRDDQTGPPD
jgi:hypothetical protein